MFQIMNSVKSNHLSLKYKRLTLSDCAKIKGVRQFQFVANLFLNKVNKPTKQLGPKQTHHCSCTYNASNLQHD